MNGADDAPHDGVEVIKNAIDKREYRVTTLPNGLRTLLVSDPETDLAAAALNVNVGYFSDPPERPGLAHFLEHMLFLGTEKYPGPDAWREFVNRHGGRINAFVTAENTVYFFEIDRDRIDETLDRFAQFFISPLFDTDYVQRERVAVDSEYRMGMREDGRRLHDVLRETVNPAHPLAKFSVGSLSTLADHDDDPVRDAVIAFHERHYSAGLMTLAVVGAESLDDLEAMVRARFGAIPYTGAQAHAVAVPVRAPGEGPLRIDIVPLRESRELRFDFTFPWHDTYHLDKPASMLGHLIGHEGTGSLHELLKERGWINALSAGGRRIASNEGVFSVSIDLTPEGLDHIAEIGEDLFRYIALVDRAGIRQGFHDELKRINELNFEFREGANPAGEVIALAGNLQIYPDELALFGPYSMPAFDERELRAILARLRPDRLRLSVVAPDLATDRSSRWYETGYRVSALDEDLLARWTAPAPDPALALPQPNRFLPDDTALHAATGAAPRAPVRLIDGDGIELWHLQDTEFAVPRADIHVTFEAAHAVSSLREHVLTKLYLALARDTLNARAYPARLAGLGYSLHANLRGFGIDLSGYDDKQRELLDLVVDTLTGLEVDPARFELQRAELVRQWDNARLARPFIQLRDGLQTALHAGRWPPQARIDAILAVTPEDLEAFIPRLFDQVRLEVLVHGNATAADAETIGRDLAQRVLAGQGDGKRVTREVVRLEPGRQYLMTLDIDHDDSGLVVHYQAPDDSVTTTAAVLMLEQLLKGPFFDTLRTRDQLGYVVGAHSSFALRVPGLNFVIQSPVAGPATLLDRVDEFLVAQRARIAELEKEEFEGYRQGLLTILRERDTSLNRRSRRLQHDLALGYHDFAHRERLAEAVEQLTHEELLALHEAWLLAGDRRRIVAQSAGHPHRDDALDHRRDDFVPVTSPVEFRAGLPAWRL